jgi:AmiR/NasT family two-component response regulator
MLTPDEELRVASCIDTITYEIKHAQEEGLNLDTQLWLAEKLKELNDTLKILDSKSQQFDCIEDKLLFIQAKTHLMAKMHISENTAYKFFQSLCMENRIHKAEAARRYLKEEGVLN